MEEREGEEDSGRCMNGFFSMKEVVRVLQGVCKCMMDEVYCDSNDRLFGLLYRGLGVSFRRSASL